MKKLLLFLLILSGSFSLFSQAPEGFIYSAVIRDNLGNPIANQSISFRFTILKGDPAGILVYQEKHYVISDQFGVVTLIIGDGLNKVGDFASIDWGSDSYFLKIELDKSGGSTYTDFGTSQFMSVPYALFAKASGSNFSGDYNDLTNKPVLDGSETKISAGTNVTLTGVGTSANPYIISSTGTVADGSETKITSGVDITVTGAGTSASPYVINFSGSVTDGSGTKITGGANVTVTGTGTNADPYVINSNSNIAAGSNMTVTGSGTSADPYVIQEKMHYVGESYGGGVVFHVYDNGRHGLIASGTDQDLAVEWSNGTARYTNTTGNGVHAGEMNTTLIIALQTNDNPAGNFAAKVCADYSVTIDGESYGDWYLPSKLELTYLYQNKDVTGNFLNNYYWSSTEFSSVSAWALNFENGSFFNLKKNVPYAVRAIRAF